MEGLYFKNMPVFKTPEEELAYLREHISRRESELKIEKPEITKEQVAKETVKAYGMLESNEVLAPAHAIPEASVDAIVLRLKPENHDAKMEEFLGILLDKGIKNALSVVAGFNNPHLDDDFHRFLVQYLISHGVIPGLKPETPLFKALHMKLFEITLPDIVEEKDKGATKAYATLMEQLLYGMQGIASNYGNKEKNYFTIEIALSNVNDHIVFYASVPENSAPLFEKQLLALYPNAILREVTDDYNIFGEGGGFAAAHATLSSDELFPIRTYEHFEHDPLEILINSFSKLESVGEGASIQFTIAPTGDTNITRFTRILESMKKGMDLNRAKSEWSGIRETFGRATKDLIFGVELKKDKEKEDDKKPDDMAIARITEKVKATIMSVEIKIVAGARTRARAMAVLSELESAFHQFDEAGSNGIRFKDISERDLPEFLHNFSYRMFNEEKSLHLNMKEIATLVHFPKTLHSQPQLKSARAGEVAAPLEVSNAGVLLGLNHYRGAEKKIFMDSADRLRHLYVLGQTGTGKTSILKNLIVQDIKNGDGCCFIDPHGTDVQDILAQIPPERAGDVIYFDPSYTPRPMGLNMLEYDINYPEQKSFVVDEMLSIFNKLFDMKTAGGPMFEQYFRNAVLLVLEGPNSGTTLLDVARVLSDEGFRKAKLLECKNPIVAQFWEQIASKAGGEASLANIVPYITSKFDIFLSNEIMRPIISQEHSAFNFRKIMDEKKILLVNLSKGRLGDINANLLGLIIVGKISMAALSRVDMYGKPMNDFYLYIDEFQNVTTPSIATILSEARKYHLSLTLAHQYIGQLEEGIKNAVFGNVGSMAIFRVGAEDAQFLEPRFLPEVTKDDLIKIENYACYMKMLVHGQPAKPFSLHTLPPEKGNPELVEKIKELSYLSFGRDRAELEEEIMARYRTI